MAANEKASQGLQLITSNELKLGRDETETNKGLRPGAGTRLGRDAGSSFTSVGELSAQQGHWIKIRHD